MMDPAEIDFRQAEAAIQERIAKALERIADALNEPDAYGLSDA